MTACCPGRAGRRGHPYTAHWFVVHDRDGAVDLGATCSPGVLPRSDLECAAAVKGMLAEAGRPLLHGDQTGRFLLWDGSGAYSPRMSTFGAEVAEWAAAAVREAAEDVRAAVAAYIEGRPERERKGLRDSARQAWGKHHLYADRLWSDAGQTAFERQLAAVCGVDERLLDAGTGEIVLDNGTLSYEAILRTRRVELLPHDQGARATRRTGDGAAWEPGADCPVFKEFLRTSVPDAAQRDWLCWRVANALFGRMPRKGFVNLIGERDSGKSTFTETIAALAGGYAKSVAVETFLVKHTGDQGFLLHELMGARFAHSHEPRPGGTYDESFMKRLTGRDRMRTRTLYGKPVEWSPQCTPFIGSNGPVRFNTSDDAFMGRQEVVRFQRGYASADPWLAERLRGELNGILTYLVSFIVREAWHGMPPLPQSSAEERERLAEETEDSLSFVADQVEEGRLGEKQGLPVSHYAPVKQLYSRYQFWCGEAGVKPVGRKTFCAIVGRRYPVSKSGVWVFRGLVLSTP